MLEDRHSIKLSSLDNIQANAYFFLITYDSISCCKAAMRTTKIPMPRQASQCQMKKLHKQDPALANAHSLCELKHTL
jgi:hypothetical protein